MRDIEPGDEIAGYRIEGVAGRGGMGVVYRAIQLALDRPVALKVIAPEFAADPHFRRRFERESRMAGSIRHPNVITIYDAREDEGLLFITMDFIEGTDLRELLSEEGALDPPRAVELVSQVASALDAAHARGLIHRDVKPANVLLVSENGGERAYLTDFGLGKTAGAESSLTGPGGMVGTTDYAAPEQLEGKPVDARADVYGLTCVLFQALTGRVPYVRDTPAATMFAHITAEPPSVLEAAPGVPEGFDAVVRRGMAKQPDGRYPSAGNLATAAQAAADGRPIEVEERSVAVGDAAAGESAAPPAGPRSARRPRPRFTPGRVAALLGAAAAVLVLVLVSGVFSGGSEDEPRNPAGEVAGRPIPIMPEPISVDVANGGVWVGGGGDRARVVRVDARTGAVGRPIRVVRPPVELIVGGGAVWANTGDSITRIDPRTRRAKQIPLPAKLPRGALQRAGRPPLSLAVAGDSVWVANTLEGTVTRLDVRSNEFGRPIRVRGRVGPIAVTKRVVFVGVGRALRFIDRESEKLEPGTRIRTKKTVMGFEQGGNTVFAIEQDAARRAIAEPVDARTGTVGTPVSAREGPYDFVVGGGSGWVSYAPEGTVDRIELVTRKRIGDPIRLTSGSSELGFGEGALWAANVNAGTLTRIEP